LNVRGQEVELAQQWFNVSAPEDIQQYVNMAFAGDVRTGSGDLSWQVMAALSTWDGYSSRETSQRNARSTRLLERRADLERKIRELETGRSPTGSPAGNDGALANAKRELSDVKTELQEIAIDPSRILGKDDEEGNVIKWGPRRLAERYREGMRLYNSEALAFFHVVDEGLASRISYDPTEMSVEDGRAMLGHLQKAGLKGEDVESFAMNMFDLGFVDPMFTELLRVSNDKANAGSGRIILKPDMTAIRQGARDMYRELYMEEPSDEQLNSMSAAVAASITGDAEDTSVSPDARLREVIESQPQYEKYYGNKPGGMSEGEYRGMHQYAQQSMLGGELADNQPTKVGMQQGAYQTTVGAAMGTKEAWDNSTFLGRLAKAAETVGANT